MKGFTGKLVIQFTAKVRSLRDLDRRIAKVMTAAERHIGGELWEVSDLRALPGPTLNAMLEAVGQTRLVAKSAREVFATYLDETKKKTVRSRAGATGRESGRGPQTTLQAGKLVEQH